MDNKCVFCQIAKKAMPAKIEYEDEEIIAFWDINPSAPVHLLIIPKEHIASINDARPENQQLLGKMLLVAKRLAKQKKIEQNGYRLVINTGPWAGQIIHHLHLHLLGGNPSESHPKKRTADKIDRTNKEF
uniref:Histidine triad nucleotide-binding protein n=1 Tax=candidate division CPR3 bacterium TaxID=2268181 RepID=A0A7V3J9H1_UNCC3